MKRTNPSKTRRSKKEIGPVGWKKMLLLCFTGAPDIDRWVAGDDVGVFSGVGWFSRRDYFVALKIPLFIFNFV